MAIFEDVVTAKAFALVDDEGRHRAGMFMMEGLVPSVHLYDVDGTTRLALGLDRLAGPYVALFRSDGSKAVEVGILNDDTPGVLLHGSGDGQLLMSSFTDAGPIVSMLQHGVTRATFGVGSAGPSLMLIDEHRTIRASMSVSPSDGPQIKLSDDTGKSVWQEP